MLTEEQISAVETNEQKCAVMAGAGSGKTTLLVSRVIELLSRGASPGSIMVITFTRAAAREIRERLGEAGHGMQVGTFHSVIMREMANHNYRPNVLDDDAEIALLDSCAAGLGMATVVDGKVKYKRRSRKFWKKHIDECRYGNEQPSSPIVDTYTSRLLVNGDVDFSGILADGYDLAKRGGFRQIEHVIVDEAQDNETIQWKFVKALGKWATVMVCGDVNQCIHEWRGAKPEEFAGLGWHTYKLTQTFRNPLDIVSIANRIPGVSLTLRTEKPAGSGATAMQSDDVVSLVRHLCASGLDESDIAILCRYNEQVDRRREQLYEAGIPVAVKKQAPRGPVYWLLRYLGTPSSQTARVKAADAIRPYAALTDEKLFMWIIGSLSIRALTEVVATWLGGAGVQYGPRELLSKLNLPSSMLLEANYYADAYDGETMEFFVQEESCNPALTKEAIPGITVTTIHQSKGLEWEAVIIPEMDAGVWPRNRNVKPEEYRLLYVAVTRTKDALFAMHGERRSEFVDIITHGARTWNTQSILT